MHKQKDKHNIVRNASQFSGIQHMLVTYIIFPNFLQCLQLGSIPPDKGYCFEFSNIIRMLRFTPNMNSGREDENILLFSMTLSSNGLFIKIEYELFNCLP